MNKRVFKFLIGVMIVCNLLIPAPASAVLWWHFHLSHPLKLAWIGLLGGGGALTGGACVGGLVGYSVKTDCCGYCASEDEETPDVGDESGSEQRRENCEMAARTTISTVGGAGLCALLAGIIILPAQNENLNFPDVSLEEGRKLGLTVPQLEAYELNRDLINAATESILDEAVKSKNPTEVSRQRFGEFLNHLKEKAPLAAEVVKKLSQMGLDEITRESDPTAG